jgi:hypothetical protein
MAKILTIALAEAVFVPGGVLGNSSRAVSVAPFAALNAPDAVTTDLMDTTDAPIAGADGSQ